MTELTFDKLQKKDLVEIYEALLRKLENFQPDSNDYSVVMAKINHAEEQLRKRFPNYFKVKDGDTESVEDSIYDLNYSLTEASVILGITRQTLITWSKKGLIKTIKFIRKTFVPKTEIERIKTNGLN